MQALQQALLKGSIKPFIYREQLGHFPPVNIPDQMFVGLIYKELAGITHQSVWLHTVQSVPEVYLLENQGQHLFKAGFKGD